MASNTDSLEQNLIINESELHKFKTICDSSYNDIPKEHHMAYIVSGMSLKSKQCNEPYELLLSNILNLKNIETKHGWDAIDNSENPKEYYEYKPSSKKDSPTGQINDDSGSKINKNNKPYLEGKKTWMILAGIDKDNYTFNSIYKFPMEIYHESRKQYLENTIKKNKTKQKQTRVTYQISVPKSIKLCKEQNKPYYVWKL
jgi:hypothetical protein